MYTELELVKMHLKIDKDFVEEDGYIIHLIGVAERAVADFVRCKLSTLLEDGVLPDSIRHAILLMLGDLYNNRESVAFAKSYKVPYDHEYLLSPYVNYRG